MATSSNKKSNSETTNEQTEIYYELNIENLTINVQEGGVVIFQSGNPNPPPPKPPGGNQ